MYKLVSHSPSMAVPKTAPSYHGDSHMNRKHAVNL